MTRCSPSAGDRIALDARNALNRVVEAVHVVKGFEAVTSQAERFLHVAETGYRHDAESNLLTARTNLARAEYLTARTCLLSIMGENLLVALTDTTFGSACQADSSAPGGYANGESFAPMSRKETQ